MAQGPKNGGNHAWTYRRRIWRLVVAGSTANWSRAACCTRLPPPNGPDADAPGGIIRRSRANNAGLDGAPLRRVALVLPSGGRRTLVWVRPPLTGPCVRTMPVLF